MIRKEYPDEGEFIVGTVTKVQNYGAFVTLDEYNDREGFVHIAEIATGWVKRIRNHIKEKQKVVCKVMSVDETKGHVDLSLKRVNEHQKREKIKEWKNNKKSARLFEMLAEELNKTIDECWDLFGRDIVEKYGSLYDAFDEAAYDQETLKNDGFSGEWVDKLNQIAKDNIAIQFVEIKAYLDIKSWESNGIKHIQTALQQAEKSEYDDVNIQIHYIGAPHYSIIVQAPDYKIAEEELKKAVDRVEAAIITHNGEMTFHRKLDE
jgi:translation initiation factor 2 subunit 1